MWHVPEIARRPLWLGWGWGDRQKDGWGRQGPGCMGLWTMVNISVRSACDGRALEGVEQGSDMIFRCTAWLPC